MGVGVAFSALAAIAGMIHEEHHLFEGMRREGNPPTLTSEVRCYPGAIAQINLLIPVLQMAALNPALLPRGGSGESQRATARSAAT